MCHTLNVNTVQTYSISLNGATSRLDIARLRNLTEIGLNHFAQLAQDDDIVVPMVDQYLTQLIEQVGDNAQSAEEVKNLQVLHGLLINSVRLAEILRQEMAATLREQ